MCVSAQPSCVTLGNHFQCGFERQDAAFHECFPGLPSSLPWNLDVRSLLTFENTREDTPSTNANVHHSCRAGDFRLAPVAWSSSFKGSCAHSRVGLKGANALRTERAHWQVPQAGGAVGETGREGRKPRREQDSGLNAPGLTFCSVHTRERKIQPSKRLRCREHSCQSCRLSAQSRLSYLNFHPCPVNVTPNSKLPRGQSTGSPV